MCLWYKRYTCCCFSNIQDINVQHEKYVVLGAVTINYDVILTADYDKTYDNYNEMW